MMRAIRLFSLAVLALVVFSAPAMANGYYLNGYTEEPGYSWDGNTADHMFLFVSVGPDALTNTSTNGLGIFNIGPIDAGTFPFSTVDATAATGGATTFTGIATTGREFVFIGGLTIFDSSTESTIPHLFMGVETTVGEGGLSFEFPAQFGGELQAAFIEALANMDNIDAALGSPGGFTLGATIGDFNSLVSAAADNIEADVSDADLENAIWDDSFSEFVLGDVTGTVEGLEAVFAHDPTWSSISSTTVSPSGVTAGVTPIPEPGSIVLVGFALAGFGLAIRRRRHG